MEIVNPVPPEELAGWATTLRTTFLQPPDPELDEKSAARWADRLRPERTWGVRDRGRWVATLASDERRMTLPGGVDIGVSALTGVTVNATHRRRGLLTSMLTAELTAARDRGDAVSYLVAAEWPIYGRFGYGPATRAAEHVLHTRTAGVAIAPGDGAVRQVEPTEWAQLGPEIFDATWGWRAGEISRRPQFWQSQTEQDPDGGRWHLFVHEGPGGADGMLAWKPERDFELDGRYGAIRVDSLLGATPDAYRGLWAYLSGIDVVEEVRLAPRPVDEPVRWLLSDGRALRTTQVCDMTWVALVDVPAALTARGYRSCGRLVLEVTDETVTGFAGGRFLLDASPEGASCTPTRLSPDLTLPLQNLGSAYLGDFPLGLTRTAMVQEHTVGAIDRFDLMFGTSLTPFCSSGF